MVVHFYMLHFLKISSPTGWGLAFSKSCVDFLVLSMDISELPSPSLANARVSLDNEFYHVRYFAPDTMVTYKRERLLAHPLVVKLIRYKWGKLGRWLNFLNLLTYTIFIVLLTGV